VSRHCAALYQKITFQNQVIWGSIWLKDYAKWKKRDLPLKRYVYFWVDRNYCNVRMDDKQCILVIIGATENGTKELVALEGGFRESELSWTHLLLDLKGRCLDKRS
jgi:transposase-like protein